MQMQIREGLDPRWKSSNADEPVMFGRTMRILSLRLVCRLSL
jgi:hypothetical protein